MRGPASLLSVLLALPALVGGCSHEYAVVIVAGSDDVLTEGLSWELTVVRGGCEAGAATGQPPTGDRVVRSLSWNVEQEGPEVGELDPGRYGFYVRVRDASCTVRWAGCADVDAEAGGDGEVTISLAAVDGPGCDDGLFCTGEESCDETATCHSIAGTQPDCDDHDSCTVDVCEEPSGCRHVAADSDADGDGYSCGDDCDDGDRTISPGASEQCNGRDDDCDDAVDEGDVCGGVDDQCLSFTLGDIHVLGCLREQTWAEGVQTCLRHDGTLTAAYVDENTMSLIDELGGALPPEWWIGVHDEAQEGHWVDVSGEPMGFTQWAAGEPDGGETSDCVMFSVPQRGWRDAPCSDERPIVCEVP